MDDEHNFSSLRPVRGRGRGNRNNIAPPKVPWGHQRMLSQQPEEKKLNNLVRIFGPSISLENAVSARATVEPKIAKNAEKIEIVNFTSGATRISRTISQNTPQTKSESVNAKKGQSGTKIELLTNYFELHRKTTWTLYQYSVQFTPNIEENKLRKIAIKQHRAIFGEHITDGSMLFCSRRLENDTTRLIFKNREDEQIHIDVKFTGILSPMDGHYIHVLNIILRRVMENLNLQLVGRNYYDAKAAINVPEFRLQIWPGYITSIRQHEAQLLMCVEITHKIMRNENIYNLMKKMNKDEILKTIVGQTVMVSYGKKNFYRIDDIDFNKNPSDTFSTSNDKTLSFVKYYSTRYGINIKDPKQPLLISRAKARDIRAGRPELIALIPELCSLTGIDEKMRDNQILNKMLKHTRIDPIERISRLLTFNKRFNERSHEFLKEWTMELNPDLLNLTGRELPLQTICFGNNKFIQTDEKCNWTNAFYHEKLFETISLENWYFLCPSYLHRQSIAFAKLIKDYSNKLGFIVSDPIYVILDNERSINCYLENIEKAANADPQMIVCVLSSAQADKYAAIKKKCCVERAIPTQVLLKKTIVSDKLASKATKVAIQMSCKLGCRPWMISIPVGLGGVMVIGFDVCHNSRDKRISYGALVATMDMKKSNKYYSTVIPHSSCGEELCSQLAIYVLQAVREYRELHKCLPCKIIFYRDGVGDGQINQVVEHELVHLKLKLEQIYQNEKLKLKMAFIIVTKRMNTRFFVKNSKRPTNPRPGTVIDDVVTLPERYDFYCVSQSVSKGTVSPTNYNVIYDNLGLSPDQLQMFTYQMSHLYYNWSGTIRVPAVCQYAHKLAFLVGQYLHNPPSNSLRRHLYFL